MLSIHNTIGRLAKSFTNSTPVNRFFSTAATKISRGNFAVLNDSDITYFQGVVGEHGLIKDENDLQGYNTDWMQTCRGFSKLVVRPKTTEQVSKIVRYCNDKNLAICPQGGNTGIAGGCIPVHDEIILSTSLMNEITSLDQVSGILVCQSGCILEKLNEYLNEYGFIMPVDLGSKESCLLGGNVSTNAGGLRVLRYGSFHSNILGLEVVLADGTILDILSTMRKDNTGYDLKHLFIGAEGTLGIVTKVSIQCPPKYKAVNLAFLALNSYEDVLKTYKKARIDLGEILSAVEYIDSASFDSVEENIGLKVPTETKYPFYLMIETNGSNGSHDEEKLNTFLETVMTNGIVQNGTVASQPGHIKNIWEVRERLAEALNKDGYFYCFDFSIPIDLFDKFVIDTRQFLSDEKSVKRTTGFGHLGDSNIHLNVTTDKFYPHISERLEPFVYKWVANANGSISSEHGIGIKKKEYLHHSKSIHALTLMRQIKNVFDPKGIMNPYKVLPEICH